MENAVIIKTERSMAPATAIVAIAGIGAVVLAILALAQIFPVAFASIAAIAVGVAFLIEGLAISANYSILLRNATNTTYETDAFTGGLSTEFIGGVGVIILGILSLLNVNPLILLPVIAIALGGTQILGGGATIQLSSLSLSENEDVRNITSSAVKESSAAQILVGLAAITLGIISLTVQSENNLLLSTIAILAVGAVEFLKGSSLGTKMMKILRTE